MRTTYSFPVGLLNWASSALLLIMPEATASTIAWFCENVELTSLVAASSDEKELDARTLGARRLSIGPRVAPPRASTMIERGGSSLLAPLSLSSIATLRPVTRCGLVCGDAGALAPALVHCPPSGLPLGTRGSSGLYLPSELRPSRFDRLTVRDKGSVLLECAALSKSSS